MIPLAVVGAINTYSRGVPYNTLIEGVGASILTEADLAFKLNNVTLVAGDISYFLNDGTDVYARIDKTYTIKSIAWNNATDILAFYDFEGMVLRINRDAFKASTIVYAEFPECTEFNSQQQFNACSDLIWCRAPKLQNLNYRTFYQCGEMTEGIYPAVTSITTHTTMANCFKNIEVDLRSWDGITGGNTSTIAYNYALERVNIDSMISMPYAFMRNAEVIRRIDAPELVTIDDYGIKENYLLEVLYAPKLETIRTGGLQQSYIVNPVPPSIKYIPESSAFYLMDSVPMIALPELTSPIGTSSATNGQNFRSVNNGGLGATLVVPLVHQTSNAGGEDADIVDFRTWSGSQVVKYNDADIAINGGFDADTDWIYSGTSFSISGGLLNCNGSGWESVYLASLLTVGVEYLVVLDLKETNAGGLRVYAGDTFENVDTSETGMKVFLITCTTDGDFTFETEGTDPFVGAVDNLKIYPIN